MKKIARFAKNGLFDFVFCGGFFAAFAVYFDTKTGLPNFESANLMYWSQS